MMLALSLALPLLAWWCSIQPVIALPALDGMYGRSPMGGLVEGTTPIEAIAMFNPDNQVAIPPQTRHLTTANLGSVGNLTILPNDRMPAFYYLRREQLWQYINETTILPVNVHNVTVSGARDNHPPFQLVVGKKVEGVKGGTWRFAGSMLYYDFPGKAEMQGLFYKCEPSSGFTGVFMFCQQQEAPTGCEPFTLHSWIQEHR